MSYFGSWQAHHVPDTLALVPWADMMRHSSEAGEWRLMGHPPWEVVPQGQGLPPLGSDELPSGA